MDREQGRDANLTRQVRGLDRWFWYIPLPNDRSSIGVVLDAALYKQSKKTPEEFLEEAIAQEPFLARRMTRAHRVTKAYASADFSYRQSRFAGDRWLLAGDAAGFIDPVFSSGVFLALLAGEQAADILDIVLDHPQKAPRLFKQYERLLHRAMDGYLRFVESWYSKEFIEVFLYPQDVFQIPPAVNAVLGGNISGGFAIRWRMKLFYCIVWLQRYLPLCPRRTLVAKPAEIPVGEPLRPAA
jgi:FADH2-dependent halogenase